MKRKEFIYAGYFLAGCMDLAAGVLIVSVLGALFYIEVPLLAYPLGAFLAVLPDMDLMRDVVKASVRAWDHHGTFMHKPMIVLPVVLVAGAAAGLFFGEIFFYALLFVSCVFWHYVHDMKEMGGYGIAWLWPFSRNYWSLRGSESPEQAFKAPQDWYRAWIHPTPISVRELSFAALFLTSAPIFDLQLTEWALVLVPLFAISVFTVWLAAPKREG